MQRSAPITAVRTAQLKRNQRRMQWLCHCASVGDGRVAPGLPGSKATEHVHCVSVTLQGGQAGGEGMSTEECHGRAFGERVVQEMGETTRVTLKFTTAEEGEGLKGG